VVKGLGFRVQGSGFRVWGLGFRVWDLGVGRELRGPNGARNSVGFAVKRIRHI